MLESVRALEWLKLFVSIITFLGPGLALVTTLNQEFIKSPLHLFVISIAVSVAIWAILLAWLDFIGLKIGITFVWGFFLLGWIIGIANLVIHWKNSSLVHNFFSLSQITLWLVIILSGVLVFGSLRHQVAGLGSDSYHHTLITQLINNNGGLPDNYRPANDEIISFSYHYGYHAAIAALMWLSGWGPRLLVLASGPLLVMYAALANALLAEEITNRSNAGIFAAAFTGVVCVFPIYSLNWGRYPQLASLALMPVFLSMVVSYFRENSGQIYIRRIIFLAILASGVALVHYRVAIMAAIAVVVLFLFVKRDQEYSFSRNVRLIIPLIITALFTLLLVSPWLWHVYISHQAGYAIQLAKPDATYFSIQRLDSTVLNYPTNLLLLGLASGGFLWGLIKRKWFIFWAGSWSMVMLLLSGPRFLSTSMDTISVIISLFVPASLIVSWFVSEIYSSLSVRFQPAFVVLSLVIFAWSASLVPDKNLIGQSFVTPADLEAAEWIKDNVPYDAYFMVNMYKFGFSDNFIIGIDAGFWLPLLAERRTVTMPMVTNVERFRTPDDLLSPINLYGLGADLTSKEAIQRLTKAKISHIYIGELGGPINPDYLINSKDFSMIYRADNVFVFEVNFLPTNND